MFTFISPRVLLVFRLCCYFASHHSQVRSAHTMAALAPAQIYSLNLGLSEIGNKINQIQQQLDKTEDLVNNLSQLKVNQGTSLMLERQVGEGDIVTLSAPHVIWQNIMKQYFRWNNLNLMTNK